MLFLTRLFSAFTSLADAVAGLAATLALVDATLRDRLQLHLGGPEQSPAHVGQVLDHQGDVGQPALAGVNGNGRKGGKARVATAD
jgi:hypothetical protein